MILRQLFLAVVLSITGLTASAQTTGTSAPLTGNWNNVVTGTHPNNCCTGGPAPLYDPATGIIHFSYSQTAVHRVIAINQALSGSGIQINGYNWGYDLRNMNGVMGGQSGTDSIVVTTFMTNRFNQFLVQDDRHYNTQFDWTRFSGTVGLPSTLSLADAGSLGIQFIGGDSGFWGGYYGPQVRNVEMTVNYTTVPVDPCVSDPQSSPLCPGYKTYYNNMWDDGYQQVDLPFTFPFYGQNFNTSYMFTNGVVGFLDPNQNSFCCSGINMNSNPGSPWNYAIYGLQTDLGPGHDSRFWSQVGDGGTSMRYGWDRVYDLGTSNASTFNIQIKDTGYIGINYESINSQYHVTAGIAGDISQGEYSQIYHGWGGAFSPNAQYTFTGTEITDQCVNNPLWSTTCPGYQQAYFNQQCSYNPLYNSQCPGYAQAYFTQQCNQNTLYDPSCPGYATAYYNYQCSVSALYHTGCPGYSTAYFNQQCGLDPLYSQQCNGYADAYYVQQCTLDALYDSGCTGYTEAYAKEYILVDSSTTETEVVAETVTVTQDSTTETKEVVSSSSVAAVTEVAPSSTSSTVSASPAVAATAPVAVAAAPAASTSAPTEKKSEKKSDAAPSSTTSTSSNSNDSKNRPVTTRQALAQRRMEAAREQAAETAKENPGAMTAQMDSAASMEQQVEIQSVVLGAMSFVAGFDAYGRSNIPDAVGYKPFTIYNNQTNVDNARMMRGLSGASDRLHEQMVDQQYR